VLLRYFLEVLKTISIDPLKMQYYNVSMMEVMKALQQ
jgi:hypothetical protein